MNKAWLVLNTPLAHNTFVLLTINSNVTFVYSHNGGSKMGVKTKKN